LFVTLSLLYCRLIIVHPFDKVKNVQISIFAVSSCFK